MPPVSGAGASARRAPAAARVSPGQSVSDATRGRAPTPTQPLPPAAARPQFRMGSAQLERSTAMEVVRPIDGNTFTVWEPAAVPGGPSFQREYRNEHVFSLNGRRAQFTGNVITDLSHGVENSQAVMEFREFNGDRFWVNQREFLEVEAGSVPHPGGDNASAHAVGATQAPVTAVIPPTVPALPPLRLNPDLRPISGSAIPPVRRPTLPGPAAYPVIPPTVPALPPLRMNLD